MAVAVVSRWGKETASHSRHLSDYFDWLLRNIILVAEMAG